MKTNSFYTAFALSISFFALNAYAQIEGFYPEAVEYQLHVAGSRHIIYCSSMNSAPARDSISIRAVQGTYLVSKDSSGTEKFLDSCYFIVIDSAEELTYELWCINANTDEKFIIPFDSDFTFFQTNVMAFYLQLLVKKGNEIMDSSSHYFERWIGFNITAEESSFQMPDFSIKTQRKTSSIFVSYTLSESALVSMVVYSGKGQTIKTIMNDFKHAGIHTQTVSTDGFFSGTYLMKFDNNKQSVVKKFHLFK